MRRVALEGFPAGDGPRFQLLKTPDHFKLTTLLAFPDGQRQSPIAFLEDHPVAHVAQPVEFALQAPLWNPAGRARGVHDALAPAHVDEPLVYQAVDQLGPAAPTMWISVQIALTSHEQAAALEIV